MKIGASIFRAAMVASIFFVANLAQASWVGVQLFTSVGTDHIHLTVSDENSIEDASMLNIWMGRAYRTNLPWHLRESSNFLLFRSSRTKEEIENHWNEYFKRNQNSRNIITNNCADASAEMLSFALGQELKRTAQIAHVILFVYLPNFLCPIRLPQAVFKQSEDMLKEKKIPYYSYEHLRGFSQKNKIDLKQGDTFIKFLESIAPHLSPKSA
jgi:hypothetical protein